MFVDEAQNGIKDIAGTPQGTTRGHRLTEPAVGLVTEVTGAACRDAENGAGC